VGSPVEVGIPLTMRRNVAGGEEVVKPIDYRSNHKAASWKRGMRCSSDMIHSNRSAFWEHLGQVERDCAFQETTLPKAVHLG